MVEGKQLITITGVTGFLGSQVLKTFLEEVGDQYRIRATVRDKDNEKKMEPLKKGYGQELFDQVEFVNADLMNAESLDQAIAGSTFVIHTASPVPTSAPADENEVIKPAVEGVEFVIKACQKHKVQRVVMTSSVAAVAYHEVENTPKVIDETVWSTQLQDAYAKSKTFAEQYAWNFLKEIPEGEHKPELVTILPTAIFGPPIAGTGSSVDFMQKLLNGMGGNPRISLGFVDSRDVALAHLRAMQVEGAANQRIIVNAKDLWFREVAQILHEGLLKEGYNYPVTQGEMSYCSLRCASFFTSEVKPLLDLWDRPIEYKTTKVKDILGMEYRDVNKAIIDMALKVIEDGKVPEKKIQQK